MKSKLNFCEFLIAIYSLLLVLCLMKEIACLGYYSFVFDKETRAYFHEKVILPEYDKETGEVTKSDEVTVWEYSGFIPENFVKVNNYFTKYAGGKASVEALVLLGLFLPMLICYRRTYTKPYFPIVFLALIHAIALFVLPRFCGG